MAILSPTYPLIQLPSRMELLLFLIKKEDLKSRKFFDGLRELGLDEGRVAKFYFDSLQKNFLITCSF